MAESAGCCTSVHIAQRSESPLPRTTHCTHAPSVPRPPLVHRPAARPDLASPSGACGRTLPARGTRPTTTWGVSNNTSHSMPLTHSTMDCCCPWHASTSNSLRARRTVRGCGSTVSPSLCVRLGRPALHAIFCKYRRAVPPWPSRACGHQARTHAHNAV